MTLPGYEQIVRGWSPDLRRRFPEERFHFVRETRSTNDDLLQRLRKGQGAHLDLIQADFQTGGRGRRGDKWEAPAGSNLLFSVALRLPDDRAIWTRLPHLTATIAGRAVESILPGEKVIEAKWPNDLMVGGKKLAGILVETVMVPEPFAVVGIGLNVNMRTADLPGELRGIATSLYDCLGCESSRSFLLGLIVQGFIREYPEGLSNFEPVRAWMEQRNFLKGKEVGVTSSSETVSGTVLGLGAGGELLLNVSGEGLKTVISAEKIVIC
ncbi:MAG: biotin--[acetyl-CoA-carboxylase] ligase [Verrucomicrobiales bacterium]|nr:biotin--[acetyl-CoA-carboxylase] ligase [Verrucomicrobiales bacterium]